jgi:hypothetical protein
MLGNWGKQAPQISCTLLAWRFEQSADSAGIGIDGIFVD